TQHRLEVEGVRRSTPDAVREERCQIRDTFVEAVEHRVDLSAHARRDDDRLGYLGAIEQQCERLVELVIPAGDPIEKVERALTLVEPDDYDRHDPTSSGPLLRSIERDSYERGRPGDRVKRLVNRWGHFVL